MTSTSIFRRIGWSFFFSGRRRHTRSLRDWSSDVCSSDLLRAPRRRLDDLFLGPAAWRAKMAGFGALAVGEERDAGTRFPVVPPESIDRDLRRLREIIGGEPPTVILCDNAGQVERLEELLGTERAVLAVGALDGGFLLPGLRVLTDHEIFRRARRLRRPRRYRSAVATTAAGALTPGDFVVHLDHGIGVYRGLQLLEVGGGT